MSMRKTNLVDFFLMTYVFGCQLLPSFFSWRENTKRVAPKSRNAPKRGEYWSVSKSTCRYDYSQTVSAGHVSKLK